MKLRDAVMWLVMAAMVAGLYWLHAVHMIRTNFNLFLAAVFLMSAAVTALALIVRPDDGEESTSQGGTPGDNGAPQDTDNKSTANH